MASQHGTGSGNVQVAVSASQNVTITINGQEIVELAAPAFPRQLRLPEENGREIDLLKAAYSITGFEGRSELLDELVAWCLGAQPISARTITGPGGAGKTRLAYELYRYFRNQDGWGSYFLQFLRSEARGLNLWDHTECANTLLIVDYASDFAKPLGELLRSLQKPAPPDRRLRLLLLARTADWDDGWLASLRSGRTGGEVDQLFHPRDPQKIAALSANDRREIFAQTLKRFAEFSGRPEPEMPPAAMFERADVAERLKDPLTLMMAAAAAVRSGASAALNLVRTSLALETAKELVANRMKEAVATHQALFLHMAGFATLCGGLDKDEALEALDEESRETHLGPVADPEGFMNVLQAWIPGDKSWIGTIQPDIVGEAYLLGEKKPVFLLDAESAVLRAAKRKPLNTINSVVRVAQDFSFAAEIARQEPLRWIEQLIERGKAEPEADFLVQLADQIPASSLALRSLSLRTAEELFAHLIADIRQGKSVDATLGAAVLDTLTSRRSAAGLEAEARDAARQAVDLRRELVESGGDSFAGDLAGSLNNLAIQEGELGNSEAALQAAEEAEEIYRGLARQDDVRTLRDWAIGLETLAVRQSQCGLWKEALVSAERSVDLHRQSVQVDREQYLHGLAGALLNLSTHQAEANWRSEALSTAREATDLFRELATFQRDETLADLAIAVDSLSNREMDAGQAPSALEHAAEAVNLRRELVRVNRRAFLSDLATSLHNLSLKQGQDGRKREAAITAQEAVDLWRELVSINRSGNLNGLAASLHNLSSQQGVDDDLAFDNAEEAVQLWREVVSLNRKPFLPDLAGALNDFGRILAIKGRDEATAVMNEAVQLWLEATELNPDAYAANLAKALNHLADRYNKLGEHADALTAAQTAVEIYRRVMEDLNQVWFIPARARAQAAIGAALSGLGDHEGAAGAYAEALKSILKWIRQISGTFHEFAVGLRQSYLDAARAAQIEPDPALMDEATRVLDSKLS